MAKKQKPAEKRRMRQELGQTERRIAFLRDRADKFAGSWVGRKAKDDLTGELESAEILRMYV